MCLPDMSGQMLTTGEAEIARWKVGAVESLALFLLSGWPLVIVAIIVRPMVNPFVVILAHFYILRVARLM